MGASVARTWRSGSTASWRSWRHRCAFQHLRLFLWEWSGVCVWSDQRLLRNGEADLFDFHGFAAWNATTAIGGYTPHPPTLNPPALPLPPAKSFLALPGAITNTIRERLSLVAGGHIPLARLVQHALAAASCGAESSVAAASAAAAPPGQGSAGAAYHGAGLATSQEVHAHARALPLLLGCYLESQGRLQVGGATI